MITRSIERHLNIWIRPVNQETDPELRKRRLTAETLNQSCMYYSYRSSVPRPTKPPRAKRP